MHCLFSRGQEMDSMGDGILRVLHEEERKRMKKDACGGVKNRGQNKRVWCGKRFASV